MIKHKKRTDAEVTIISFAGELLEKFDSYEIGPLADVKVECASPIAAQYIYHLKYAVAEEDDNVSYFLYQTNDHNKHSDEDANFDTIVYDSKSSDILLLPELLDVYFNAWLNMRDDGYSYKDYDRFIMNMLNLSKIFKAVDNLNTI